MFCVPIFLQHLLLLLLFFAVDYAYLSPSNVNLRYNRETSSLTEFPRYGNFNLVLENGDDFLKFIMCCKKSYECHQGTFLFCFGAGKRFQGSENRYKCDDGTCAYKIEYKPDKTYELSGGVFETSDSCFTGKITNDRIYVRYSEAEKDDNGCVLDIDSENRLNLFIRSIPPNVTVTALNAKKYLPPTTTISTINATGSSQVEDEGMSDEVKYTLIGIGILLLVLILGGTAYGIYRWRKSKKSLKPPTKSTVKSEKPTEIKEEGKTNKKESKAEEHPKVAPPTVVSSAEPKKPSKEPTASAEPAKQLQASREQLPSAQQQCIPATELPKAPPTLAHQTKNSTMAALAADPDEWFVSADGGSSTHKLVNSGASRLAFIVKSTNTTEYLLEPVCGFVEAGASAPLGITRLAGPPQEDLLVVQFAEVAADVTDPRAPFKAGPAAGEVVIPVSAA